VSTNWLATYIDFERQMLENRAKGNFYYPDDPRYKGDEHKNADKVEGDIIEKLDEAGNQLTDEQRHLVDPEWPKERLEYYTRLFTAAHEQLKLCANSLIEPLPERPCEQFGHIRSAEEAGRVRFRCMECMAVYDCEPEDKTTIFFGGKKYPYDINTPHDRLAEEAKEYDSWKEKGLPKDLVDVDPGEKP